MTIQQQLFEQYASTLYCLKNEPEPEDLEKLLSACVNNIRCAATMASEAWRMRYRIECLRGALMTASGKLYEVGESGLADNCIKWAGDMEPPLIGANVDFNV